MLEEHLQHAHRLRLNGRWAEAFSAYEKIAQGIGPRAELLHNMALCIFAQGQYVKAEELSRKAVALNKDLWQAQVLLGKAQRHNDASGEAADLTLKQLSQWALASRFRTPDVAQLALAHASIERAEVALNAFCDPEASLKLAHPFVSWSPIQERAQLTSLVAQLYCRTISDQELSESAIAYAAKFLTPIKGSPRPKAANTKTQAVQSTRRPRIGLLSPSFHAGPIYYLCYQTLEELSKTSELIFFHRGTKFDWASENFTNLSSRWEDVQTLSWKSLAEVIQASGLDLLLELGGWMDAEGLKAVASLQGISVVKWVGGQAMTTGLPGLSGFITDPWQTPQRARSLFTEPLWFMGLGYVSYKRPAFWPGPSRARRPQSYGIIGNPSKISSATVSALVSAKKQGIQSVWLIDRRYQYDRVRERVRAQLEPSGLKLEFVASKDHKDFLKEVSRLEFIFDTRPYSAGLTAREALSLGVQIISANGPLLFSSRHGLAAKLQQEKLLKVHSGSPDITRQDYVAKEIASRIQKSIRRTKS